MLTILVRIQGSQWEGVRLVEDTVSKTAGPHGLGGSIPSPSVAPGQGALGSRELLQSSSDGFDSRLVHDRETDRGREAERRGAWLTSRTMGVRVPPRLSRACRCGETQTRDAQTVVGPGPWGFKSLQRYFSMVCSSGRMAEAPAFQAGDRGSIPLWSSVVRRVQAQLAAYRVRIAGVPGSSPGHSIHFCRDESFVPACHHLKKGGANAGLWNA